MPSEPGQLDGEEPELAYKACLRGQLLERKHPQLGARGGPAVLGSARGRCTPALLEVGTPGDSAQTSGTICCANLTLGSFKKLLNCLF